MLKMRCFLACLGLLTAILLPGVVVAADRPAAAGASDPADCPALLQGAYRRLTGGQQSLCPYAGHVLLVVNTASHCGFTPQYEGLEALHRQYADRGLVVLGFPSADFGGQEFDQGEEIARYCKVNFGVSFPLFARSAVSGDAANPLFRRLREATGVAPGWNFHKYLVSRDGQVRSFDSDTRPQELVPFIQRALDAPRPHLTTARPRS